jgi:hypothetical protein
MTELYLILHKVRGEPAFDIASPLPIGDEEGWIIPTSGHRAYPLTTWNMSEIGIREQGGDICHVLHNNYPDWDLLPDHYQPSSSPKETRAEGNSILASLGLPTKVHASVSGKLTRRI